MAKHSMRGYYAIGALVVGIILLYVMINTIEPFANEEIVYVYFKIGSSQNISNVTSSNKSIVSINSSSPGKLTLKIDPQYILTTTNIKKDIQVNSISNKNCINALTKLSSGLCLVKVKTEQSTQLKSNLSNNILTISGLYPDDNLAYPDITINTNTKLSILNMKPKIPLPPLPPQGTNISIILKLTKK